MTAPFGGLTLPATLQLFALESPVGELTAFRALPAGLRRGVVLYVPGHTGSKEDARFLTVEAAARGWEAIAYSQRGQGDSAAPKGIENYTLEAFSEDVAVVARQVADGELVHLIGHSLGGLIAREAVIRHPDLFADLTMLCSGPAGRPGRRREEAEFAAAHGLVALWERGNPAGVRTESDAFERARFEASSLDNYLGGTRILQDTVDSTDELVATHVPSLVAHGDADDAWPIPDQFEMSVRMGAEYRVIPGAGHLPNIDNPVFTATALSDFWANNQGES